jgi:hypothetical protein
MRRRRRVRAARRSTVSVLVSVTGSSMGLCVPQDLYDRGHVDSHLVQDRAGRGVGGGVAASRTGRTGLWWSSLSRLGSHELGAADTTAELYRHGMELLIVFTGATSRKPQATRRATACREARLISRRRVHPQRHAGWSQHKLMEYPRHGGIRRLICQLLGAYRWEVRPAVTAKQELM